MGKTGSVPPQQDDGVEQGIQGLSLAAPQPLPRVTDGLTPAVVASVAANSYARFAPAAPKQAFVTIERNASGEESWKQYQDLVSHGGAFRPIEGVVEVENQEQVRCQTPNGTILSGVSERALRYEYVGPEGEHSGTLVPTSPITRPKLSGQPVAVYANEPVSAGRVVKRRQATVNPVDMAWRRAQGAKRKPTQKEVMGQSAEDEIRHCLLTQHSQLTPQAIHMLNRVKQAEWLHLVAYSLMPTASNPQQRNNLVAGLARDNTRMMVIEKCAKLLSGYEDVNVAVDVTAEMMPGTEIAKAIHYELTLNHGARSVKLIQDIDVFSEADLPRNSDQLLVTMVLQLLAGGSDYRQGPVNRVDTISAGQVQAEAGAEAEAESVGATSIQDVPDKVTKKRSTEVVLSTRRKKRRIASALFAHNKENAITEKPNKSPATSEKGLRLNQSNL